MSPLELEQYLHRHIPLSKTMGIRVAAAGPGGVVLSAPLEPNINHRETVFGGSASALAILSAWSLVHIRLLAAAFPSRIVIQRNTMEYKRPMRGSFTARAWIEGEEAWTGFTRMLQRKGRGRIRVLSVLESAGEEAGAFSGEFVAFAAAPGGGPAPV